MVEMQFGDFITCGFNQIVNNVAKTHWRWGGRVPMVIRAPVGAGRAPALPLAVRGVLVHGRGRIKVVAPATPHDAKGLLIAAFEDGNPVLYLEHKLLYRSAKGPVPVGHYSIPLGQARVAREGRNATVVTYGVGVPWALEAAAELSREGREIEVIDLRSLVPWDVEAAVRSVAKTGRCLVLARGAAHRRLRRRDRGHGRPRGLRVARRPGRAPRRPRHAGPLREGPRGALLAAGTPAAGAPGAAGLLSRALRRQLPLRP